VLHVLVDHIAQLRTPLNTSRPSANHSEVEQHLLHLFTRGRQTSHLETAQKPIANLPRIAHVFQEISVLSHTFRVERLRITPNPNYQFIPPHLEHLALLHLLLHISDSSIPRRRKTLNRIIDRFLNAQRALVQVNAIRPALEKLWTLFQAFPCANGFQRTSEF
jgi:hypothetical protein